jgi:hypothetical protein
MRPQARKGLPQFAKPNKLGKQSVKGIIRQVFSSESHSLALD